jgi:uncharacterized protein (DUF302 family)
MLKNLVVALLAAVLVSVSAQAHAVEKDQGVYVKMAEGMKADVGQTAAKVKQALTAAGYEVIADYSNGVPAGCNFKAATVVFTKPDYAAKIVAGGPDKAFGLPLRVGIYEDEKGVNIAMVNPVSMNRSFFLNNSMDAAGQSVVDGVKAALASAGASKSAQMGQMRKDGEIRGIGGGKFPDKLVEAASSAKSIDDVASALAKGIASTTGWHSVYTYKPAANVAIVGITNTAKTEGRAFSIAGDARSGKSYKFPGIDHAAAFPVELVVYAKGGKTGVFIVDEMWRMKLYFEDAGMWAFMKNMSMPGEIQDEIEAAVKAALK